MPAIHKKPKENKLLIKTKPNVLKSPRDQSYRPGPIMMTLESAGLSWKRG